MVKHTIKKTSGAAGPSGMDTDGWTVYWFQLTLGI